jgi:dihydroceramidase
MQTFNTPSKDNYVVSRYLAEFWNTVSNIPFIFLGLFGMWQTRGLRYRSRYALLQGGIAVIGTGSMIFHATLKWHAQVMLDELPMIFVSALALYLLVVDDEAKSSVSRRLFIKLGLALIPICVSVA